MGLRRVVEWQPYVVIYGVALAVAFDRACSCFYGVILSEAKDPSSAYF